MAMLKGLLAAVLSLAATGAASGAGAYPDKPVRLYVGFAPGGATDLLARLYAKKLGEKFNQTFIVENRPGAGGISPSRPWRRRRPTVTRSRWRRTTWPPTRRCNATPMTGSAT